MILKIGILDEDGRNTCFEYFEVVSNLRVYPISDMVAKISEEDLELNLYRFISGKWVKMDIPYRCNFPLDSPVKDTYVTYISFIGSNGDYTAIAASEHLVFVMNDDGKTVDRY